MVKRHYRLLAAALISVASAVLVPAVAAGASARSQAALGTAPVLGVNHPAPAGVKPRMVGVVPPMEPNPATYAAQKAAANAAAVRRAGLRSPVTSSTSLVPPPAIVRNWPGQQDSLTAPSDSTGAIGTTRYIELVNPRVGIYSRTSKIPTARGPLLDLTGCATSACTDDVFDPQIIWDPATNRFIYATDDVVSSSEYYLDIGFSTSATPTLSAGSWCRYNLRMAPAFPDYPKLGDTKDFILVGTNEYTSDPDFSESASYIGSQIAWVAKPPSGSACPAASTFKFGFTGTLKNADGTDAFTPVPGNQTDTSSTGWATAIPASIPSGGARFLTLFKVTKSSTGAAVIPTTGSSVPVSAYSVPASAPQPGTTFTLDTSDARPTQAVLAVDPAHGGVTALWTQHTVFGGAGAQVRWYEINPATHSLIQHGTISSSSRFTFDGAISPDRRVNGTSSMFGGDMVIDVVQSSSVVLPTIKVASKIGTGPISALTPVATSAAPDTGEDCYINPEKKGVCRWGDYAAATPDPAAPTTGTTGEVWGSSMLAFPGVTNSSFAWATRNFAIQPLDNNWNTAIEVPGTAALNTGGNAEISSVSCTSPGNCSAGGRYADGPYHYQAFVINQTNGTWGTAEEVPGIAALNQGGNAVVNSVSCTSTGNCSAGGYYADSPSSSQAFVVIETNGTWGTAEEVPGTAALNQAGGAQITSVSCASAGNCSAGGDYYDGPTHYQAFVVSETNGTWDTAEEVPGTAALNQGGGAQITSVSCASAGNCSAGGYYARAGSAGLDAFAVSETNGTWGTAEEIPGTAALGAGAHIMSVSCGSVGNCSAGGYYFDNSYAEQVFVVNETNGTWGTAEEIPGTAALNQAGKAYLGSVSCASAGNCTAGGNYAVSPFHYQAFVVSETNGTWGTAEEVPGTAALNQGESAYLYSVSCPAAGACSAGGYYTDASGNSQAFVIGESNGTWGTAEEVPGTAALNQGGGKVVDQSGGATVRSVSCASAGNCSVGGSYTDSSYHSQAFVVSQASS